MPPRIPRLLSCAFLALALPFLGGPAWGLPPQITHHELEVVLDPDTHWLEATDQLHVSWDPGAGQPLVLTLSDALKVETIEAPEAGKLDWSVAPGLEGRQQLTVLLPPSAPAQLRVRVAYRGAIADTVEPAGGLSFVAGDRTRGIIDPEGIYLSGETGWMPTDQLDLATFRVGVTLPYGWEVCTQGRLIRDGADRGGWRSEWESVVPSEGLALVAGRYTVERRQIGNLTIATYLFPEHASASAELLDLARSYIERFEGLLGPYPFPEFAIVENFFSSGYAFPGFTLLGRGVLAQPARLREPGYLDHEIVHNWWGNGVLVDQEHGNWCEALTTYYANYMAAEATSPEEAEEYRQRAMLRYSLYAPEGEDYPLALFESKTTKLDDAVGYTKGAMLFHLLRRAVGDEIFWPTLREIAQAHVGTRIGWQTFVLALAERSGQPLDKWVGEWLQRPGVPQLRLVDVRVVGTDTGYVLEGALVQSGQPFTLPVPLRVDTAAGPVQTAIPVRAGRVGFALPFDSMPMAARCDPAGDILRRLEPVELRPCLNRTLYDRRLICVYPEDPRDPRSATYRELAERAAADRGGQAVPLSEVTTRLIKKASILLFGGDPNYPVLSEPLEAVREIVSIGDTSFTLRGVQYEGVNAAVLATAPRADDPAHSVTVFAGNDPAALERAAMIFFYGWDSVIRFEGGRPADRFDVPPTADHLYWEAIESIAPASPPSAVMETIRFLADPWLLGRLTGQPEMAEVRKFLTQQFARMQLEGTAAPGTAADPFAWPFAFDDPQVTTADPAVVLRAGDDAHRLPVWPVWWSAPAPAAGRALFAGYGWADAEWNDYGRRSARGHVVIVFGAGPRRVRDQHPLAILEQQARIAEGRGAAGLLAIVPRETLAEYLPAIALPYPGLPWPAPRSPRGGEEAAAAQPALDLRAARVRTRVSAPAPRIGIPVWIMPWDGAAEPEIGPLELARWQDRLEQRRRTTVVLRRVECEVPELWHPGTREGVNLVGIIPGTDPLLKDDVVVLGAHYDHLGLADTGEVYRGANDNASGVAALLAAGQMLNQQRESLRRTIALVAFDAEEWGLRGSRALVESDAFAPRTVRVVVNADSVGHDRDRGVSLVGQSRFPWLGDVGARWARLLGLTVGPDIDAFAYEWGSDHWPFAEAGVPALDVYASDYAIMDSTADTPEQISPEHVVRIARLLAATAYELATRPTLGATPDAAEASALAPPADAPPIAPVE